MTYECSCQHIPFLTNICITFVSFFASQSSAQTSNSTNTPPHKQELLLQSHSHLFTLLCRAASLYWTWGLLSVSADFLLYCQLFHFGWFWLTAFTLFWYLCLHSHICGTNQRWPIEAQYNTIGIIKRAFIVLYWNEAQAQHWVTNWMVTPAFIVSWFQYRKAHPLFYSVDTNQHFLWLQTSPLKIYYWKYLFIFV